MNEAQFYSFSDGISRMFSDIEGVINPLVSHFYPVIQLVRMVNTYIVVLVFCALLFHLVRKRKHTIKSKLNNPKNYYFAGALLVIYAFLSEAPIRLGPKTALNLGLIVLPTMAKSLGPLVAGIFGIIQYATSFVMHQGEAFSIISLLIASISGMIYGWILYMRKFTYLRCLWAKFAVNMLCNVFLTPVAVSGNLPQDLVNTITHNTVLNILFAPLQALLIYLAISALKKIKIALSEE